MQRVRFATKAVLQDLYDSTNYVLSFSDLRQWIPGVFSIGSNRGFLMGARDPEFERNMLVYSSGWSTYIGTAMARHGTACREVVPQMRLAAKIEPAGKVRVFTILDSLSQRLLQPLHEWLCDILRVIP